MEKIIELLKKYEYILITAGAPKKDIKIIHDFIENLEGLDTPSINDFYKYLQEYGKKNTDERARNIKPKTIPATIEKIASIYHDMKNGKSLTNADAEILSKAENKYPHIRSFLLDDLAGLYNRVSEVDEKKWTLEELKIIFCFHFSNLPKKKTTKTELLNEIKKNIYNIDYMDSMKKQYEGNETEENVSPINANSANTKSDAAD